MMFGLSFCLNGVKCGIFLSARGLQKMDFTWMTILETYYVDAKPIRRIHLT